MKFVFFIVLALMISVEANPGPHPHPHPEAQYGKVMCMGKELQVPDSMNSTLMSCHQKVFGDSLKGKPPKDHTKIMCLFSCHAEELGLIDDNRKIVQKEIDSFIGEVFPKESVSNYTSKVKKCIEEFGSEEIQTEGSDCGKSEKVGRLYNCAKKAFFEVCMPDLLAILEKDKKP